jgi:hypothetical protein
MVSMTGPCGASAESSLSVYITIGQARPLPLGQPGPNPSLSGRPMALLAENLSVKFPLAFIFYNLD